MPLKKCGKELCDGPQGSASVMRALLIKCDRRFIMLPRGFPVFYSVNTIIFYFILVPQIVKSKNETRGIG